MDVIFDLDDNSFKPFNKPNNVPMYVHKDSNHPKNITDNLPTMIQNRLYNISSDESKFDQEKGIYNKAIADAGYNHTLKYTEPTARKSRRVRKVYYFNPPFSKVMSSDLTKMFNQILISNFPKSHRLHKLLNSNNSKISYSCTPNMGMIIAGHNKKLLNEYYSSLNPVNNNTTTCDFQNKQNCPLNRS